MFFIEDKNFLNNTQKKFIDDFLNNPSIPYYLFYKSATLKDSDDGSMLSHALMKRPEHRENKDEYFCSPYSINFFDMLKTFTTKHNIKINELLRGSINLTFNNEIEKCLSHLDHNYPHYQLLLYLNDTDGDTVVNNKKIKPEKYKGICFDSQYHYHFYPKKGLRAVVVFTFR